MGLKSLLWGPMEAAKLSGDDLSSPLRGGESALDRSEPRSGATGVLDPPDLAMPAPTAAPIAPEIFVPAAVEIPEPADAAPVVDVDADHSFRLLAAAALSVAFLVLTAMNITTTGVFRERNAVAWRVAPAEALFDDLVFAIQEIRAYESETGTLPETLAPFDLAAEPGWSYARLPGGTFRLARQYRGYAIAYDSQRGLEDVRATRQE